MFEHVRIAPHRLISIIATVRLAGGPDGLDNLRPAPYAFSDPHCWRAGQFRGRQRHPYRAVRLPPIEDGKPSSSAGRDTRGDQLNQGVFGSVRSARLELARRHHLGNAGRSIRPRMVPIGLYVW